jgi:hypothetical protein
MERRFPARAVYSIDGYDVAKSLAALKALPTARLESLELIKGHHAFGLHLNLPRPAKYITVLRDPVDRVASVYRLVSKVPGNRQHDTVKTENLSLHEFAARGLDFETDNGQCRLVTGRTDIPIGECQEDLLDEAKANLRRWFRFVGITERYDESLVLLRRELGWPFRFYRRWNTLRTAQDHEVSAPTRRLIEDLNQYDRALYDFARAEIFEPLLANTPHLQLEVAALRAGNAALAAAVDTFHRLPPKVRSGLRRLDPPSPGAAEPGKPGQSGALGLGS